MDGLCDVDSCLTATYQGDLNQQVARLVSFLENEQVELANMDKAVDAYKAEKLDAVSNAMVRPSIQKH